MGTGGLAPGLLNQLRQDLAVSLAHPVRVMDQVLPTKEAFVLDRQQYSVDVLLQTMQRPAVDPETKRIAVTDVDLFLPVFAHVLGSAQLNGQLGIASTHRLCPMFAGEPMDLHKLRLRILKEVMHELGHTFGLVHCQLSWCVMNASLLPEHVDLKDPSYCGSCAEVMNVPKDGILSFFLKGDNE